VHAGGCGRGLGRVPGAALPPLRQAGGRVAGDGVPAGHEGLDEEGERDGALDGPRGAVAGVAGAGDLLAGGVGGLDGLITNDKFCCVRRVRLSLTWWRRPLRLRGSALRRDVALVGEPDDPDLDRVSSVQPASRRGAPVGSGLSAAGAPGRGRRAAGSGADRRGGT